MFRAIILAALTLLAVFGAQAAELNKATQAELESIGGIGPSMSGRILDERKKASFKDWSDFASRVKGVGQKTATKFSKAGLTVNGAGYDGSAIGSSAKAGKPSRKKDSAEGAAATGRPGKARQPA